MSQRLNIQKTKTIKRIEALETTAASGKTQQLLESVKAKLGSVPNLFRVLGHSSGALEGYLRFSGALATGELSARVREQIALTVAEINDCDYCRRAHSFLGGKVGLSSQEILDARRTESSDPKTSAILKLARELVVQRGVLTDAEFQTARDAGLS